MKSPKRAIVIMLGFVLVIALIFVGFHWVKPEHLRLKLKWNCLEFEMGRQQQARNRARE